MNHIYQWFQKRGRRKYMLNQPQIMKRDVADAAFKIQMVVIIDPSLLCCVNLQASLDSSSFSRLKRLWRRNGSNRRIVTPQIIP